MNDKLELNSLTLISEWTTASLIDFYFFVFFNHKKYHRYHSANVYDVVFKNYLYFIIYLRYLHNFTGNINTSNCLKSIMTFKTTIKKLFVQSLNV